MAIIMYRLVPAAFVPGLWVVSGESLIGASEMIQFIARYLYISDYHNKNGIEHCNFSMN